MHPRIRLVAIALLTFTLTSRCAAAFAQQTVGEVTSITGVAKLDRGGNEVDLKLSMPIEVRDRLRTTAKAKLTVTFRDGSKLVLSESSSYTIDQYAMTATTRRQALIRLWIGHLRAIVKMAASGVPNFEVHTPNAIEVARGTEFETAYIADRPCPEDRSCMRYTTVGVFHGVVAGRQHFEPGAGGPGDRGIRDDGSLRSAGDFARTSGHGGDGRARLPLRLHEMRGNRARLRRTLCDRAR